MYNVICEASLKLDYRAALAAAMDRHAFETWMDRTGRREVVLIVPCEALPAPDYTIMPFARWMDNQDWRVDNDAFPGCVLFDGMYNDALVHHRHFDKLGVQVAFVEADHG